MDATGSRFTSFSKENEIIENIKESIPKSTQYKENWAKRMFMEYNNERNKDILNSCSSELMVLKEVNEMEKSDVSFLLPSFINDVRKKDGSKYPAESLRQIVCAIFHYFKFQCNKDWDFFHDSEFCLARKSLDATMKRATKEGIGMYKRKAEFISADIEERLWDGGFLGSSNPRQLLTTMVYLIGLNFGLRARKEHRQLRAGRNSQLRIIHDAISGTDILRYTEDCQKNRNGGLNERNIEPKVVDVYETESERNIVKLYKKYIGLRPSSGKNIDNFYLQPLEIQTATKWYKDQALGENSLGSVIKKLFENAGISGHFTNHSLRRSKVSRMFQAGADKEEIKRQTGHRSDSGVMAYREFSSHEKFSFQMMLEKPGEPSKNIDDNRTQDNRIHIEIRNGDKSVSIDL